MPCSLCAWVYSTRSYWSRCKLCQFGWRHTIGIWQSSDVREEHAVCAFASLWYTLAAQAGIGVLLYSVLLQYGLLASTSAHFYVTTLYCSPLGRATRIGPKLRLGHVGVEPEHILSSDGEGGKCGIDEWHHLRKLGGGGIPATSTHT